MRENHVPPTIREIGAEFGFSSPNGVRCHLKALMDKGELIRVGRYKQYIPAKSWLSD